MSIENTDIPLHVKEILQMELDDTRRILIGTFVAMMGGVLSYLMLLVFLLVFRVAMGWVEWMFLVGGSLSIAGGISWFGFKGKDFKTRNRGNMACFLVILAGSMVSVNIVSLIAAYLLVSNHNKKILAEFLKRQVNLLISYLLFFFTAFGYIANVFQRNATVELLFLWRYVFPADPGAFVFLGGFAASFLLLGYSNLVGPYALKSAFWLANLVILSSWFWFWILHPYDLVFAYYLDTLTLPGGSTISTISFELVLTLLVLYPGGMAISYAGHLLRMKRLKGRKDELEALTRMRRSLVSGMKVDGNMNHDTNLQVIDGDQQSDS